MSIRVLVGYATRYGSAQEVAEEVAASDLRDWTAMIMQSEFITEELVAQALK